MNTSPLDRMIHIAQKNSELTQQAKHNTYFAAPMSAPAHHPNPC